MYIAVPYPFKATYCGAPLVYKPQEDECQGTPVACQFCAEEPAGTLCYYCKKERYCKIHPFSIPAAPEFVYSPGPARQEVPMPKTGADAAAPEETTEPMDCGSPGIVVEEPVSPAAVGRTGSEAPASPAAVGRTGSDGRDTPRVVWRASSEGSESPVVVGRIGAEAPETPVRIGRTGSEDPAGNGAFVLNAPGEQSAAGGSAVHRLRLGGFSPLTPGCRCASVRDDSDPEEAAPTSKRARAGPPKAEEQA